MPHTWIVWSGYAKSVQSHNYTRNECCRVPSVLKTSTFSIRECENTFYMSVKRHNLLDITNIKKKRESLERNSLKILRLAVAICGKLLPIPIFILFESGLSADFRWLKTVKIGLKRAVSVENYDFLDW